MGAQRTTFEKLQRDRAKKAKAAAKREKRLDKSTPEGPEGDDELTPLSETEGEIPAAELLQRIEALHNAFENKEISFEDFEEEKAELMSRLSVD